MGPTETESFSSASREGEPTEDTDAMAALDAPVRELRLLVDGLPPGLTDRRLLGWLEERGILRGATVERYLDLRHRSAYAHDAVDAREARSISSRLRSEIDRVDSSTMRSLLERLLPKRIGPAELEPPERVVHASPPLKPTIPESELPGRRVREQARMFGSPRLLALLGLLLFLLGFSTRDLGGRGVAWIGERFLGRPSEASNLARLATFRKALAKEPDSLRVLTMLAGFALRTGYEEDAILALQRIVAVDPDHVRGLNGLAWAHATSDDPLIRDPTRALAMAERAYALSPEPRVANTLAKAAFLNGDVERAIRLGEEAVEKSGGKIDYYRRQLATYRASSRPPEHD